MSLFAPFPKLARLSREVIVTEKIDGTNAQVIIEPASLNAMANGHGGDQCVAMSGDLCLYAGSRTRLITPGKTTDNYGFAAWVAENADCLAQLGVGRHFGEWYGKGIQRSYGLDHRRFALFNSLKYVDNRQRNSVVLNEGAQFAPACCDVVPILCTGGFDSVMGCLPDVMETLETYGSRAVPGFMNPEGIVVYHTAAKVAFKKTFDDRHKEQAA